MNYKILFVTIVLFGISNRAVCQSEPMTREQLQKLAHYSPELLSSVYHTYPAPRTKQYTKPPKGYRVAFMSHYGRHGSRYLIDNEKYKWILSELESAELTDVGTEMLSRVRICWKQAEGRGGELTSIGEEQHRDIASRMVKNFPTLFLGSQQLNVLSSTTPRCILSMTAFCERLKELNPRLQISRDVSEKNMPTMTCIRTELQQLLKTDTPARSCYESFKTGNERSKSFVGKLMMHPEQCSDSFRLTEELFQLAQDMQDCGRPTELLSFFQGDELFQTWQIKNLQMYLGNGDSPLNEGKVSKSAQDLLRWICNDADQALAEHRGGATLRFGHDTSLSRLITCLGIVECCPNEADPNRVALLWQDFNTIPMAANLQLIFYQNRQGHTLLRLLLNENEVHLPLNATNGVYYDWEEVKSKFENIRK